MIEESRPLVELTQQAVRLLYREMGIVDTVRVLRQFSGGYGDYTKERDILFKDTDVPTIVQHIKARRKS